MILWFAGGAVAVIWVVLHDPRLDYRLLVAGALLPEVLFVFLGFHSLAMSVLVLTAVMLLTRGRRDARRRWLALPLGMFAHLLLDAVWTDTELFWWPASGWSLAGEELPSLSRGAGVVVIQELVGLALLWWAYRRFCLDEGERRAVFARTGAVEPC